ncbi:inositol monophosphatase family protein [Curtobacterium sp. RHCJP20]|uniref:Inositol monophosphatase family protein n=1 Tax=Curtobacterium subtropicum TaxID=3055138 RepID=A0ABT7TBV3_9MICO|nr:inositol monophosphatase family protein [Curtobacterium subtropicum]MDM7887053.1 inositol monophosphatase family protein [Curtobacterium subtropicum]
MTTLDHATVGPDHDVRAARTLPRLVARRGAPRVRREDTLPSIAVAEALGADVVEVDVRRTADGVAVLLHDETLGRLWGDPRRVAEVSWCEVARLGNGLDRIPRLDAVLERLDGCRAAVLLHVVDPADALVATRTVAASAWDTAVAWTGTSPALAAVRAALPTTDVWLPWESLDVPTAADVSGLRPSTLVLDDVFLTPDTVAAAHDLGLAVAVRTVDEPEPVRWAARTGADLVATEDVASVRAVLAGGERDGWALSERGPTEDEVGTRAQALAHRIAHEVIAFTREHPIGQVATKHGDGDPVTDVDRAVERLVRSRVRAAFPTHGFTGEEYGTAPGDRHHWWLDPVDGTTNLVNGVPWTAMSLCLTRAGQPLVGVVADPWRGEVLEARRGRGAVLRDTPLRLDDAPRPLAGAVVGAEFGGLGAWDGLGRLVVALAERSCAVRVMGSSTLTLAQVAAGRGVGGCVPSFDPVDHGAAVLLVHEAGGVVLTLDGPVDGFPRAGEPVLVAHPGAADELFTIWSSALGAR